MTESFPYGNGESFLQSELEIIAPFFDHIILLPKKKYTISREIPVNCQIDDRLTSINLRSLIKEMVINFFFVKYFKDFFLQYKSTRVRLIRSLRYFFKICSEGKSIYKKIRIIDSTDSIFYSYWLKSTAFAVSLLDKKIRKVSRAHGSDIYTLKYIHPLHHFIGKKLMIFSVSNVGKKYLEETYQIPQQSVKLSRLGTTRLYQPISNDVSGNLKRLVSCSNCIPLKQLDKILMAVTELAMKNPKLNFEYIHFGSGPLLEDLIEKTYQLQLSNLNVHYRGFQANDLIQKFYSENYVNAFINFSTSEGVPVSIMEAISYGIPIVASDVGGNTEIVNEVTGHFLSHSASIYELADILDKVVVANSHIYQRALIIDYWSENYNALVNYTDFANRLIHLND
ncbi:glycosyltransferase [Portibacter marinus]|uniref:glycosyltransferase n=1 Tax=Portibacter marinus TaxID=2898660 RepID=UPI001F2783D2|nr:glycosyltransferase [Portibacter marinus]